MFWLNSIEYVKSHFPIWLNCWKLVLIQYHSKCFESTFFFSFVHAIWKWISHHKFWIEYQMFYGTFQTYLTDGNDLQLSWRQVKERESCVTSLQRLCHVYYQISPPRRNLTPHVLTYFMVLWLKYVLALEFVTCCNSTSNGLISFQHVSHGKIDSPHMYCTFLNSMLWNPKVMAYIHR